MFCQARLKSVVLPLTIFLAVVTVISVRANAQVVPFKIKGGGLAPQGLNLFGEFGPHTATGNATHLGNYSGTGSAQVTGFNPQTFAGLFHGSFVFVAANGDKLACDYGGPANPSGPGAPGTFQVFPNPDGTAFVQFYATFIPKPADSTGRFANVSGGSFFMVATTSRFPLVISANGNTPPFEYTWTGEGTLEFKKGK